MLRKRFRKPAGWLLVLGLLLVPAIGRSQGPAPAPAGSLPALMWAATARYVYHDDPDLLAIADQLDQTVRDGSVPAFNTGLAAAVKLEQQLKHENLKKFQGIVGDLQRQKLEGMALTDAIIGRLDDNPQRMSSPARKQGLSQLRQQLTILATATTLAPAAGAAPTAAAGAPPVADNPMNRVVDDPALVPAAPDSAPLASAPPPAGGPAERAGSGAPAWVSWLALVLSGLSFAGMMLLFRKQNQPEATPALPPAQPERASRKSSRSEMSWDDMRKYVQRQIDEQLRPAAPLPAMAAPAPALPQPDSVEAMLAPLPAPPPAPRQRTQYANEAPFNNSFPARALSDQPGTYSMFAIESSEQQPDQGTFAVTGNLASHVRDHRSVLEPVCEYVGGYPLGSESRVVTVEPGHVRRRGDDWEVVQRAKVRFE